MVDLLGQVAGLGRDVLGLGGQAGEARGEGLEPAVEAGDLGRGVTGRAEALTDAARLSDELVVDHLGAPADRLAVLGRPEPGPDLVGFADPQLSRLDLGRFMLGQLEPPGKLARLERELAQGGVVRPPLLDRRPDLGALRLEAAEGVEQGPLVALVEQELLIVLAVDLDKRPGDLGQASDADRLVVDPGARAAGEADLAGADERTVGPLEPGRDPGRLGAMADQAAVGPGTEGQAEGVDQEALAGPGLTGDHVQAVAEGEIELVDQGQVRDRQLEQASQAGHQLGSSSTLCRSRSQKGIALFGSTSRIGRSLAATSTTSPTFRAMSSRPSTLRSDS